MTFKKIGVFPPNPVTARGISTKLSAAKGKVVYANGKTVIFRDLNNPLLSTTYSGHVQNTTMARISPSGYYCASADATGIIKVWDIVGEDQVLKGEYKAISGRVNDLDWDGESKRIIAVGNGSERFGYAFMADSGSSTGDITGHNKSINAVSIRHQRPFRAATAADDGLIIFHQGVPFKFDKTIKTHTRFVHDVRYAPSGDHFASVSSDTKVFLYDGKTGDVVSEFTQHHKGSVMAVSWGPDNRFLVTSSADYSVALWDVENQKPVTTWKLENIIDNQQLGNTWSEENDIISLSLCGDLNIFDQRVSDKPTRVLSATQKAITSLASSSPEAETLFGGNVEGRVWSYTPHMNKSNIIRGDRHSNFISGLSEVPDGSRIVSVGYDDRVREIEIGEQVFGPTSIPTAAQPKAVSVAKDDTVFIIEIGAIEAFRFGQRVLHQTLHYGPSAVAASGSGSLVAIGGEDGKVRLSEWDGKSLEEVVVFANNRGTVTALAFSPNGKLLAAGDSSGKIFLFDITENKVITDRWACHTSRVYSIAWTADGRHCASASLDTHVYVWSVVTPAEHVAILNAVPGGANAVKWYNGNTNKPYLASAGADGVVRMWIVDLPV